MSTRGAEIDPDKVAIYIRWSTEDQGEGTTLDVQLDGCRHYVASQSWHVHDDLIFIDDGHSGGSMDRPALARLRKLVQRGMVQCVVCYKLDRLSRSVVDTVNLVLEEWDDLCHVKSAREPIDTTSQAGKMFFYTLVSYAEWERSTIRERTQSGRLRRAQEGRWAAGKPPYGYTLAEDKRLLVEPAEASVVKRIFGEYLKGKGCVQIAYDLAGEGVPFRAGSWRPGAVKRVLDNPVYTGELVFGVTRINPRYKKRPGEPRNKKAAEPYVRMEGGAPIIVSKEEFGAIQVLKRERDAVKNRKSGRAYSSPHLLSALAKCARCGASLCGRTGKSAGKSAIYFCRGRVEKGADHCDCGQIRTEQLDAEVVRAVKELYGNAVAREQFLGDLMRDLGAQLQQTRQTRAAVSKSLAKLDGELVHIRKLLRANEINTQEYRQMVADIERDAGDLREQVTEAEQREEALLAQQGAQDNLRTLLESVDAFDALPREQQKHLLSRLIASLHAYRPRRRSELQLDIEWRVTSGLKHHHEAGAGR